MTTAHLDKLANLVGKLDRIVKIGCPATPTRNVRGTPSVQENPYAPINVGESDIDISPYFRRLAREKRDSPQGSPPTREKQCLSHGL